MVWSAAIMGASLIVGTAIVAQTLYLTKQLDNTLSVTGSAKVAVTSDAVKWRSSFTRVVPFNGLAGGYSQMKSDENAVQKFFKDNGLDSSVVTLSPVFLDQPFRYDPNAPKEYALRQTVEIQSSDIQKITALAKNIQALVNQGVVFSTDSLEYYYSKLADLRVSLLSDAIKDAKARAQKIAESSGKAAGSIKSASMGVVQVMPVNSVDVADYGAYDTQTIDKEVMVTVKALFTLQ